VQQAAQAQCSENEPEVVADGGEDDVSEVSNGRSWSTVGPLSWRVDSDSRRELSASFWHVLFD
jgi:hypothetical protein